MVCHRRRVGGSAHWELPESLLVELPRVWAEARGCANVSSCPLFAFLVSPRMEGAQEPPSAQPDAKRHRQEPLTEAQELEAQQMLLPRDLTFKLKPSSGPVHPRAVKARPRSLLAATSGSEAGHWACFIFGVTCAAD
jgi:hypothetical protein